MCTRVEDHLKITMSWSSSTDQNKLELDKSFGLLNRSCVAWRRRKEAGQQQQQLMRGGEETLLWSSTTSLWPLKRHRFCIGHVFISKMLWPRYLFTSHFYGNLFTHCKLQLNDGLVVNFRRSSASAFSSTYSCFSLILLCGWPATTSSSSSNRNSYVLPTCVRHANIFTATTTTTYYYFVQ